MSPEEQPNDDWAMETMLFTQVCWGSQYASNISLETSRDMTYTTLGQAAQVLGEGDASGNEEGKGLHCVEGESSRVAGEDGELVGYRILQVEERRELRAEGLRAEGCCG